MVLSLTSTASRRLERKLVWLVGSPRSGSTWLYRLLYSPPTVMGIHEPLIGMHLGLLASAMAGVPSHRALDQPRIADLRDDNEYFFSRSRAEEWAPGLGQMVLSRFEGHVPKSARRCIVHDPNGSEGADIVLAALPASRLLFLARDGRDVVDSLIDASRPGSWLDNAFGLGEERTADDRLSYVAEQAARWTIRMAVVQRAYDQLPAPQRHFVRYENLLQDVPGELSKIYRWLELDEPGDLSEKIAAHAFSSIPADDRGPGKVFRSASPGLWREHLSKQEQEVCDEIMGPTLLKLGYERDAS